MPFALSNWVTFSGSVHPQITQHNLAEHELLMKLTTKDRISSLGYEENIRHVTGHDSYTPDSGRSTGDGPLSSDSVCSTPGS
jgi:hypothetical protein